MHALRMYGMLGAGGLLALSGAVLAAPGGTAGVVLTRDRAAGAKFHAPGPRTCSSTTQPSNGPISAAQARSYVICGYEKVYQGGAEQLYLIGNVQVQVSSGRPYQHVRDSLEAIDPHKLVYDIRGSSVTYTCSQPYTGPALPKPQPCRRTPNPHDEGRCYQTTFGDWRCTWADLTAPMDTDTRTLVPVPTEAEVT